MVLPYRYIHIVIPNLTKDRESTSGPAFGFFISSF
jgi:hypothetical protein